MTFADLGLSPLILKAIAEQGYDSPSPIQKEAIPAILSGNDVMAAAQTGTGKTAGFTLPILQRLCVDSENQQSGHVQNKSKGKPGNQVRALVITPTRELAAQVADNIANYGKYLRLRSTVVFGGVKINPQMQRLRGGADILVATPGRLLDLYNQNAVKFDQLEVLVLDEADRMLDMGFIHDIRKILSLLPKQRQNLLFSATFSDEIRQLAKSLVSNPVEISVTPRNTAAKTVKQWICPVDKKRKAPLLIELIVDNAWRQVLVFTRTKHGANKLTRELESAGFKAAAIHGNKSQGARTKALAGFKGGSVQVLVATDIAARGLDIDQLPQVVNFDLPNVAEDYVHRIGRTGRAGATGQAVSLVSADEVKQLNDIENLIRQLLDRVYVDGFEPIHDVPETRLGVKRMHKPAAKKTNKQGERAKHNKPQGKRSGNRSHSNRGANPKRSAKRGGAQSRRSNNTANKPS